MRFQSEKRETVHIKSDTDVKRKEKIEQNQKMATQEFPQFIRILKSSYHKCLGKLGYVSCMKLELHTICRKQIM